MGAEVGATMSTFPYTPDMRAYLTATGRAPNLSELDPTINAPFTPDLATPLSNFGAFVKEQGWKDELSDWFVHEQLVQGHGARSALFLPIADSVDARTPQTSVADLAKQAKAAGLTVKWKREDKKDEENAILTSFNHNFKPRNDGSRLMMNFLASPSIVTAIAFSGKLSLNPMIDTLRTPSGVPSKFTPPKGQDLPTAGFAPGETAFCPRPTSSPQPDTGVVIWPDSQRLERLEPFPSHFGEGSGNPRGLELPPLKVLMRIRGKCTMDHISAADPRLKYKGHLTNISENLRVL
ncbi:aconitase iron-sulfur domain-containing protein [Wolfiporia cocos MD-104 SS10]|uniref:Aconitase iron-sulfur domain-containing protein n=1 Tax=Wolfiporia cocos (strain MD-104) TaxID=742152 RepID=A0A2H3K4M4_WOLCO|nr:aconitase iron-sulfur domain-containing protein [Wolfiporia cocos MD-104 SS10]